MIDRPPVPMTSDDLKAWAKRLGLSPAEAAMALGLAVSSYRNQAYGHRPVSAQTARIAELIEAGRSTILAALALLLMACAPAHADVVTWKQWAIVNPQCTGAVYWSTPGCTYVLPAQQHPQWTYTGFPANDTFVKQRDNTARCIAKSASMS